MFQKKNIGLIGLCLMVVFSFVFIYSEAYHKLKMDYLREIVLACMGAAVTILITAMLLRQQTQSEELKDSHSEVFRKKFEVYTDFLRILIICFEDKDNKVSNIRVLEESFYKLLLFIDSKESFNVIYDVVIDCMKTDDRRRIGRLLYALRDELNIHEFDDSSIEPAFWDNLGDKMDVFFNTAEEFRQK